MPLRTEPNPRYRLKQLATQLRKLRFPSSPINVRIAHWAADAITHYLSGKAKTLNAAFGLRRKRGVRGQPLSRARIGKAIHQARRAGYSWDTVQSKLQEQGYGVLDTGAMRRIYREFRVRLASRDIAQTLDHDGQYLPTSVPRGEPERRGLAGRNPERACFRREP